MKPTFTLALFLALTVSIPAANAADCDRECLRGAITQYLNAMIAHKPGSLAVSDEFRFTEDAVPMKLGEGLWKNASGLGSYRQDILDVRQGVAASLVIAEESGTPVMLALRLKVADRKIIEVETQVTRTQKEGGLFNLSNIKTPSKAMNATPERVQIASRMDAIKIAELYPAGLKIGSFEEVNIPFASDAYRVENGAITAGVGCSRAGCENMKTQKIIKHPAIIEHVAAVDEEMGIVLLRMNFGDTGSYGPGNALFVLEAFKVYGGEIHAVEAFMKVMPANTPLGRD